MTSPRDQLRRTWNAKQTKPLDLPLLGQEALTLFETDIRKKHDKFGGLSNAWVALIPQMLAERCAFASFHRGTLTVNVNSASHMYELKQLLLAGLEAQLIQACRGQGLRKVVLKRGS
jgi:Dna[CI] antecedent, DciA